MSLLYKKKLKQKLEKQTNWDIEAVLRDYDSATQLAFTNIVLKEKIYNHINGFPSDLSGGDATREPNDKFYLCLQRKDNLG